MEFNRIFGQDSRLYLSKEETSESCTTAACHAQPDHVEEVSDPVLETNGGGVKSREGSGLPEGLSAEKSKVLSGKDKPIVDFLLQTYFVHSLSLHKKCVCTCTSITKQLFLQ